MTKKIKIEDPCPILVSSGNQNLTNVLVRLRVGTLTGCPLRSSKGQESPARWCFIFSIDRLHNEKIGWERRRRLSSRSNFSQSTNPNFWSFWQTRFLAKLGVHRRRDIFARRQANRLSFGHQQHHQVSRVLALDLLVPAPHVARNLSGDEHGLFVVDEDFFIRCTRHACGRVHSIFFCCPGLSLHTHLL